MSQKCHADIILVAYRGYSDSEGKPSQKGLEKDSEAILTYAIDYKQNKKSDIDIFVMGRSLGGAVTFHIASKKFYSTHIKGIIVENTFTSIADMVDAIMPIFKLLKVLITNPWRSIDRVPEISQPILFIKCLRDELVPPSHMNSLIKNAGNSKYVEVYEI